MLRVEARAETRSVSGSPLRSEGVRTQWLRAEVAHTYNALTFHRVGREWERDLRSSGRLLRFLSEALLAPTGGFKALTQPSLRHVFFSLGSRGIWCPTFTSHVCAHFK